MADHRSTDPGVAQIIRQAEKLNQEHLEKRRIAARRQRARGSTGAMMMGTASLSLAIVLSIVTLTGFFGISFASLSVSQQILVEAQPIRMVARWDPNTNQKVSEPDLVVSGHICLPSTECAWVAVAGLALGVMGLVLSSQRRRFSWTSAIGIALILLILMVVNVTVCVLRLRP